jgi:hypothetical protein
MAVPTTITDLSTTANSNSPAGSEVPSSGNGPDEYIRALGSIVRVMRAKGSDVASATTTDLGAATTGDFVHITGTTTITGLGTIAAGIKKIVTFDGALTLTHNGTSLILPGAANITTAANDCAIFVSEGSGNWRCLSYVKASGVAVVASADATKLPLAGGTMTGDITMSGASIVEAEGAAVTAASSTNIWATDGNTVHVTGNTGIADFATAPQAGAWMKVIFDGTPVLTHSANLNLNAGGSDITIAAGDFALVYADTTTQMDVFVIRKSGAALVSSQLDASAITNSLAADVDLNNTGSFFTGPTVAQGSTGTWFASGTVTMEDTAGNARFDVKLWDGTTVIASATVFTAGGTNYRIPVSLSGYLASPAGNIRISVKDATSTNGKIRYDSSGAGKDSTVSAFRIA